MAHDLRDPSPEFLAFWREYHICTLTTLRADGSPHVVPVGVTYDPEAGLARVITNKNSRKVANILAAGAEGARVAVSQVMRRRWATLEGRARIRTEPDLIVGDDRLFLISNEWDSHSTTLVLPIDDSIRLQFQFRNLPP